MSASQLNLFSEVAHTKNRDWTGNSRSSHATLGARNYALNEREEHDFYATEPKALELLLEHEKFSPDVWECACGNGHLGKVLERHGYNVRATDLIQREYGRGGLTSLNKPKSGAEILLRTLHTSMHSSLSKRA